MRSNTEMDEMRNSGKADMERITALLNSNLSDNEIAKATGTTRAGIGKLRNGKSDPVKMPMYNAIKLTKFAEEEGL